MKWRILVAVLVLAVSGWSGWWFLGSSLKQQAMEAWLADRRAAGWIARAEAIDTHGFPNRFDTRITGLQLVDTTRGWAYATPFIDILMLAYQPNAAIVALPSGQEISVPGVTALLLAETLRGSLRLVPGPSLELAALSVEGEALALHPDGADKSVAGVQTAAFHLRALDTETAPVNGYAMFAELDTVRLPPALLAIADPAGVMPETAQTLLIDGRVALDAPLDRRTVEDRTPGVTHLSLAETTLRWGSIVLSLTGSVEADARGYADGSIDVRAEEWRDLLAALVSSGAVSRDLAAALEFGLGFFARERGGKSVLSVPLRLEDGLMRLGPIPIGRAPRLRRP